MLPTLHERCVILSLILLRLSTFSIFGFIHACGFNVLVCLTALAHMRAMLSDPGIVPLCKDRGYSDPYVKFELISFYTYLYCSDRSKTHTVDIDELEDEESGSDSDLYGPQRRHFVGEDWSICTRCETYRPPRAHHCSVSHLSK